MLKLTPTEALVMRYLELAPHYGLELITMDPSLRRGTVYVLLARLVKRGLVVSSMRKTPRGQHGPPRRVYRLSAQGRRVLAWWRDAPV